MVMKLSQYASLIGCSEQHVRKMAKDGKAEGMPGIKKCTLEEFPVKYYILEVDETFVAEKKAAKEAKPCE